MMAIGWIEKPLGTLVQDLTNARLVNVLPNDIVTDPTIKSKTHTISIASEQIGASVKITRRVKLMPRDLVFSRLHTQNGAFAYCDREFIATTTFIPFEVDETQIDRNFLYWALHVRVPSLSASDSVGRETYKTQDILKLSIPLPLLTEQRRIVARIEALAERIAEAQLLRRKAVEEAEALWLSALHKLYDQYSGELKRLNDYATFISDGTHITPTYVDTGIPFVTVRNIADRKLKFDNIKYISQEQHETYCKRVKPELGDVLYTKDGTLGVPCFVDTNRDFSFFVSVAIIKPKRNLLDGRYLTYFLDAPQVHEQVTNTKTGALLQHIVIRAIKAIKLPVPPLDIQRRLVAYLDGLQTQMAALRAAQEESARELDALMPSILDKAFKGEL